MKKTVIRFLLTVTVMIAAFSLFLVSATAGSSEKDLLYKGIRITVDGTEIFPADANGKYVEPFIIEGTTYLPVRAVANVLGLGVKWDAGTSTVALSKGSVTGIVKPVYDAVRMTGPAVRKTLYYKNIKISLDGEEFIPTDANGRYVEPFIIDGTTYLPVRAVAGMLGISVDWDAGTNTVILLSRCPVCGKTNHTNHDERVTWNLENGVLTISGKGSTKPLTSKKLYADGTERSVEALWYDQCESIIEVVISEGITDLYKNMFVGCINLKKVTLPESLEDLGENTFYECTSLEQIDIPSGVTEIGKYAFASSGLTEITIPNGVKKLNYSVFTYNKNLKKASIPTSISEIESDVFTACDSLEAVNVDENNQYFCDIDGVLYTKDMKELRLYPAGKPQQTFTVPDGVTVIGWSAFSGSQKLEHVTLPDSVNEISDNAFRSSVSLESIDMPNNGVYIGMEAFAFSNKLKSIVIPDGTEIIGPGAFWNCFRLTSAELPDSVREIGARAFQGCELKQIHIPENLEIIGANAFSSCGNLRMDIDLPDSVTIIGDFAFANNYYIPKFTIGKNVSYIGKGAFAECRKAELVLDKDNKYFALDDDGALYSADKTILHWYPIKNGKTEYKIPSGVRVIDQAAFVSTPVSVVYLPKSIEEVRDAAFSAGCNVDVMQYEGTISEFNSIQWGEANDRPMDYYFMQNSNSCIVCGNTDHTEHTENMGIRWSITDGVLMIGGYGSMSSYSIMDPVEQRLMPPEWVAKSSEVEVASVNGKIKDVCFMAFSGMQNLQSAKLCDGIETVTASAFADCTSLIEVLFPESVTFIGPAVFRNCTSLKVFAFPSKTTVIPALMFQGCSSLMSIGIPESVTLIADNAFDGCTSLELISFGGTQEQWNRLVSSVNSEILKNVTVVCNSKIEVNKI